MIKPYFETELGKLYHGDCLEIMREMIDKSADLVLTDPPYGIKMDSGFGGFDGFGGFGPPIARRKYQDTWDDKRPSKEALNELQRIGNKVLIFGGNYFADLLPRGTHWVVWDKKNTMPTFGDCELIWTNINRKSVKKIIYEWNGLLGKEKERSHPTQKPVLLIEKLINTYSDDNSIIFDPFLGSGTTAVACESLNRRWIGIEISKEYCDIAIERIKREVAQLKLPV